MDIQIRGQQVDIGAALQEHIRDELTQSVEKYFDNTTSAHLTLSKEAHLFRVHIQVHVSRPILVQSHGLGVDAYLAFNEALGHITKRLRRYKRRLRDHKNRKTVKSLPALQYVLQPEGLGAPIPEPEETQQPITIAEMSTQIETLTVSEAVMRMDLGDINALLFHNAAHGRLNMVYIRKDSNIGWVDPTPKQS